MFDDWQITLLLRLYIFYISHLNKPKLEIRSSLRIILINTCSLRRIFNFIKYTHKCLFIQMFIHIYLIEFLTDGSHYFPCLIIHHTNSDHYYIQVQFKHYFLNTSQFSLDNLDISNGFSWDINT